MERSIDLIDILGLLRFTRAVVLSRYTAQKKPPVDQAGGPGRLG
jgi:hypothetical protein